MQRRKYLSIILVLIMLFAVFITAAAEDEHEEISADPENSAVEEVSTEQDSEEMGSGEEIIGRIEAPTNVNDLLNIFEKLEGNWVVYENGELVQDTTVTYEYLSQESVRGQEADKISIEIHDLNNGRTPMHFWVGEEEILQMEMEGQIIPKEMVDMMKEDLLSSVFAPFVMYKELNIAELKKQGKTTRTKETFGEEELDIIKIEGENLAEMRLESGMVKLADFGDFLIVVEYKYLAVDSNQEVDFLVEDLKMR
jgi:hypothetical protein